MFLNLVLDVSVQLFSTTYFEITPGKGNICLQNHALQEMYDDDKSVWDDIIALGVADLSSVQVSGIHLEEGLKLFPVVLGNKGDWSYLVPRLCTLNMFDVFWGDPLEDVKNHGKNCWKFTMHLYIATGYVSELEAVLQAFTQRRESREEF